MVIGIIKDIWEVCENNGEILGIVLVECLFMMGNVGIDVCEIVKLVVDVMVVEKGVWKVFEKFVFEDFWNERVKCMRVFDWMYFLFKFKFRILDFGW